MGLPDRFEFYHMDNPEQLYFAIVNGNNVEVSWNDVDTGAFGKTTSYSINDVGNLIKKGTWTLKNNLELTSTPSTPSTPERLIVKESGSSSFYTLDKRDEFYVACSHDNGKYDYPSFETVKDNLSCGKWILVQESDFNLHIGQAREALLQGKFVARREWNGNNVYLFMIGSNENDYWTYTNGKNDNYSLLPFIAIKNADNKVVPWTPSQMDILKNDYYIVEHSAENCKTKFSRPDKFEFINESGDSFIAKKSEDGKRYIILWSDGHMFDCDEYVTFEVHRLVQNGTWKITNIIKQ